MASLGGFWGKVRKQVSCLTEVAFRRWSEGFGGHRKVGCSPFSRLEEQWVLKRREIARAEPESPDASSFANLAQRSAKRVLPELRHGSDSINLCNCAMRRS